MSFTPEQGKSVIETLSYIKINWPEFNKWMELGRRPKEGEHALKFGRFRFFHKSQTRIATVEERKENFQKMKDAIAKNEAEKAAKAGIAA